MRLYLNWDNTYILTLPFAAYGVYWSYSYIAANTRIGGASKKILGNII